MRFDNSIEKRIAGKHKANLKMINFSGKKILDIGCGIGIFEKYCNGKEILALDVNKKDIEIAKKEVRRKNVEFFHGNLFNLSCKKKFDVVTLFDVIEHIPRGEEKEMLGRIRGLLDKRGLLLITTPYNNFTKFLDPAWYFRHRHYKKKEMTGLLKQENFKIKKIYLRGGVFEILTMFLFYIFKWVFNSEVPFKNFLDKKRDEEYKKPGFGTLFVIAQKT